MTCNLIYDPAKITVKDLMTKDVEMVHHEHTVQQAAKIMRNDSVGSVVVMSDKKPVGIMTERDFATRVVAENLPSTTEIYNAMTSPVIHVSPDDSVLKVSDIMIEKKIRKLPVFDTDKIVGIITATDILRFFRFASYERIKMTCPLHEHEELVKTELADGTYRLYCSKCERFFALDN